MKVIHPFLFAIYLVLSVYSQNASQVPVNWLIRPLLLLLLVSIILYLFLLKTFNDPEYAGFVCTIFLFWLFGGHVYRLLLGWSSFWRTPFGGSIALVLFSIPLGFLVSRAVWKRLSNHRMITTFLNVVSVVLLVIPVWMTVSTLYKANEQVQIIREQQSQFNVSLAKPAQKQPDIYLIVVDGYGRSDILQNLYDYDNSQFLNFLKEKGFYIANQSTSNYPQTELSISATMNFDYLNERVSEFGDTSDRSPLRELLQHSTVRSLTKEQGYQFVALPSAALFAQIRDADVYLSMTPGDINEFEGLLLSTTLAGVTVESFGVNLPVEGYDLHREYILYSLDKLMTVPDLPGPKFVFAHILSPHPPFIFDHDGKFIIPDYPYSTWDASLYNGNVDEYRKGYINQMEFLNKRLINVITAILEKSSTPPIIILQGDHGPGSHYNMLQLDDSCLEERYSILNAYYFPDGNYRSLYPSITPVNSFRVILNQYFGANLNMLDDRNYFAGWLSPYKFTDVTDKAQLTCNTASYSSP